MRRIVHIPSHPSAPPLSPCTNPQPVFSRFSENKSTGYRPRRPGIDTAPSKRKHRTPLPPSFMRGGCPSAAQDRGEYAVGGSVNCNHPANSQCGRTPPALRAPPLINAGSQNFSPYGIPICQILLRFVHSGWGRCSEISKNNHFSNL